MPALYRHELREARVGQKSCLDELRGLMRLANSMGPDDRHDARLADRIAEMLGAVRSLSGDLIAYRRETCMSPCLKCGSPFLPEGFDFPRCADCGAEHGTCPECGQDVLADDTCCREGGDD